MEAAWLPAEAAGFAALRPWLRTLKRGDGHPVLVLPGFMTTDRSTAALRAVLRGQGYWAHPWRLGRNIGPTARIVTGMRQRLEELHDRHERPVTLIGQSLGGVYARVLAREHPELVRQVISLGSPYRMVDGDRSGADGVWERFRRFHDGELAFAGLAEHERPVGGAFDIRVLACRRGGAVAHVHRCRARAVREHRGARLAHRHGRQPGRRGRGARPLGPAGGRVAAVRATAGDAVVVPPAEALARRAPAARVA